MATVIDSGVWEGLSTLTSRAVTGKEIRAFADISWFIAG